MFGGNWVNFHKLGLRTELIPHDPAYCSSMHVIINYIESFNKCLFSIIILLNYKYFIDTLLFLLSNFPIYFETITISSIIIVLKLNMNNTHSIVSLCFSS